jgi:thioesterase domain-containing protein
MQAIANFLQVDFDADMIDPYKLDQGSRMTDPIHPLARMLGDVKFNRYDRIERKTTSCGRFAAEDLAEVTRKLASSFRYNVGRWPKPALIAVQPRGSARPFYCVHAAEGTVSCYRDLAGELGLNQPVYAFQSPALDGSKLSFPSLQALASCYLRELRGFQLEGPYQLGGWSFGGLVAFEMALQLVASGQEVGLVVLFSSYLPDIHAAYPPLRFRDFAMELSRESRRDVDAAIVGNTAIHGSPSSWEPIGRVSSCEGYDVRQAQHELWRIYRAHVRIARRYAPISRLKRVILFQGKEESLYGHSARIDWSVAAEEVCRHTVPGNHFTIMREPNVRQLGLSLRHYLR